MPEEDITEAGGPGPEGSGPGPEGSGPGPEGSGPGDGGQDLDSRLVVEGVLFSADRPMRIVDIEEATGYERRQVTKALRKLASDYRRRNTSIEVVRVGSRWTMQVRREFTPSVRSVATPEVDPKYLRTLALIAYHQPVLQSDLQQMLGPKVYDHVRELKALGLVNARRRGATLELTTTQRFPEYFGIESAKREDIKRFLAKRAGIQLDTPVPEATGAREVEGEDQEAEATGEPREDQGAEVERAAEPREDQNAEATGEPREDRV